MIPLKALKTMQKKKKSLHLNDHHSCFSQKDSIPSKKIKNAGIAWKNFLIYPSRHYMDHDNKSESNRFDIQLRLLHSK